MFDRIREFRKKTLDQYVSDHREGMEAWKKQVMDLHERSGFLFYYESCELGQPDGSELIIQGDIAIARTPGRLPESDRNPEPDRNPGTGHIQLYLYDGQGRLLGRGFLMSDPYEKEEKRRGFLRARKHEFLLKISRLYRREFSGLDQETKKRLLGNLYRDLSLISDTAPAGSALSGHQ